MCWGGLGRVLSSGGKLWLGEVLVSVQPVNRSPLLLALTGSTRSGGTTVEPTDGLFRTPLRSVIIYGSSGCCAKLSCEVAEFIQLKTHPPSQCN
jgi:hypothetical protein